MVDVETVEEIKEPPSPLEIDLDKELNIDDAADTARPDKEIPASS